MKRNAKTKKKKGLAVTTMSTTRWSESASNGETLKEYPRPLMVRKSFINLNGFWDYTITKKKNMPTKYTGKILVPFSPESPLSHVSRQLQPKEYLWYKTEIKLPIQQGLKRILHFDAVDQCCIIYINGKNVYRHVGGYLPFSFEVDTPDEDLIIQVMVRDFSDTSYHARGKQKLKRGGMYYTAQSGIWKTVWAEYVPSDSYIKDYHVTPLLDEDAIELSVTLAGAPDEVEYSIREEIKEDYAFRTDPLNHALQPIVSSIYGTITKDVIESKEAFKIKIPNLHIWSPDDPFLYNITLAVGRDIVVGYFAVRQCTKEVAEDGYLRFFLNGKKFIQTGVLDQGYFPDGLLTAPSDDAMISDISTIKELGFNMIRKHIKIEPQRWYYHCDRLGIVVWQDMVNGGSSYKDWFVTYLATALNIHHLHVSDGIFSRCILSRQKKAGRKEFLSEMEETVRLLYNHPSIITWVPFNEGWGQFNARSITSTLHKLDKTRFIDQASGWFDQKGGDIVSLHYYFFSLNFKSEEKRILALSEYGGYSYAVQGHTFTDDQYGYGSYKDSESLSEAYEKLHKEIVVPAVKHGVSATVYTQVSDIEDEVNGIFTYDREIIKINPETVRACNEMIQEM